LDLNGLAFSKGNVMLVTVFIIVFCMACVVGGYGMSNPDGLPMPGFLARAMSK
jgi:hypothetical protein